ncbi:MAG: hypothetical protein WCJ35_00395 [Planctomycetota bacterium]
MTNHLRQIDIGFPIPEVNALALPERKVFKPIYQMGKWFARRSSAVFRAMLLAAALPAEPPDDFKQCIRAMIKERRRDTAPEPTDEEVNAESRRLYLMAMFYRNNQENPYTKGLIVLDPFMGGGTTVVEAARLGMKPIGVDVNPVAWFIAKTELEPVSISLLKDAFEQLRNRPVVLPIATPVDVPTTLEKFIKHWYTTRCPSCGGDAELIYALWVKQDRCLNVLCDSPVVRFFKTYLVAQKELRISYIEDCICPACSTAEEPKTFDWEIEPASLLFLPGGANQIGVSGWDAGSNRKTHGGGHKIRWAYAAWPGPVQCPHCHSDAMPTHRLVLEAMTRSDGKEQRTYRRDLIATSAGHPVVNGKQIVQGKRGNKLAGKELPKVVQITVIHNPKDQALWEYRGELPTDDTATRAWFDRPKKTDDGSLNGIIPPRPYVPMPNGSKLYLDEGPEHGGQYLCSGAQPHVSAVFDAGTKRLQQHGRPTPFEMECYAIEGYCPICAAAAKGQPKGTNGESLPLFEGDETQDEAIEALRLDSVSIRWHSTNTQREYSSLPMVAANFRFFKTPDPADLRRIQQAGVLWHQVQVEDGVVWPKGHAIPYGYNTRVGNDLWVHGYHDWSDMFFHRQLLCLSQIITSLSCMPKWSDESCMDTVLKLQELLLLPFTRALEGSNQFCRYATNRNEVKGILARHDFQPKCTPVEGNPWGGTIGSSTMTGLYSILLDGMTFAAAPYDEARLSSDGKSDDNIYLSIPQHGAVPELPWRPRTPGQEQLLEQAIATTARQGSLSEELARVCARPAVTRKGDAFYPWDGLSDSLLRDMKSRSDFLSLKEHPGRTIGVACCDCRSLRFVPDATVDLVITDPPFGDNVNYSELSDFFYVWMAGILKGRYLDSSGNDLFDRWEDEIVPRDRAERDAIAFAEDPELPPNFVRRKRLLQTPKKAEIIESRAAQQTKTARDYNDALRLAFAEAHRKLKPDGLMAFTFHHNDVRAWWAVIAALLECVAVENNGFHLRSVYPIVGEAETTTHHHEKQNATFDIIHVCHKRTTLPTTIKWAVFRRKVREAVRRKRDELLSIPAYNPQEGGYVSRNDLRMILLGVGFQLYSEHYGRVEFPEGFLRQAQASPRGRKAKHSIQDAARMLFEEVGEDVRRETNPSDDPAARNLREIAYAIDEIRDEIEHEQTNPLPAELESLAGEVDRVSRYYFKYLLPEHGRTIKFDDLKQLEYRTGVAVPDLLAADVLTTRSKGRIYEVKRPHERYRRLRDRFVDRRPPLGVLDRAHFLIGAIDDAIWAERAGVQTVPIDQFLVDGRPMDEAWADWKDQLTAAIRMVAAHVEDEETKTACGRALKWLAPGLELFGS